jgi:hypothetical protein
MTVTNPGIATNIPPESMKGTVLENASVPVTKMTTAVQKHVPLEVGRSEPMVLGKVTVAAAAVTNTGPIILAIEGSTALAGVLTVAARVPGVSFTVECLLTTSTARVNYAIYSE